MEEKKSFLKQKIDIDSPNKNIVPITTSIGIDGKLSIGGCSIEDLVKKYLEHIKNEKKVSTQTIKTYENIGKNIPFNLLSSQPTIMKKLKDLYDNPNTLQLYLNMIILVRKFNNEEVDKLIKFRNSLSDSIKQTRKDNLDKMDDKLPSLNHIKDSLDELTGI